MDKVGSSGKALPECNPILCENGKGTVKILQEYFGASRRDWQQEKLMSLLEGERILA